MKWNKLAICLLGTAVFAVLESSFGADTKGKEAVIEIHGSEQVHLAFNDLCDSLTFRSNQRNDSSRLENDWLSTASAASADFVSALKVSPLPDVQQLWFSDSNSIKVFKTEFCKPNSASRDLAGREFAFRALTNCALSIASGVGEEDSHVESPMWIKKVCAFTEPGGKKLKVIVKTRKENSEPWRITGTPLLLARAAPRQEAFQEVVDNIWKADLENRVDPSAFVMNWGRKIPHGEVPREARVPSGEPKQRLYASVNDSFLTLPIYAEFVSLYHEGVFHRNVCTDEPKMEGDRLEKVMKFMDRVFQSDAFQVVYNYLRQIDKAEADFKQFCQRVFRLWFGVYSRCCRCSSTDGLNSAPRSHHSSCSRRECHLGSSGWEHVHFGEYVDHGHGGGHGIVDGHHNWVIYYLQEKAGEIDYHGYFARIDGLIGTIQYTWSGYLKRKGGGFMTTSPAFDFSISTLCALAHVGEEACKFTLLGKAISMTSFKQPCGGPNGLLHQQGNSSADCLSTCYPIIPIKF